MKNILTNILWLVIFCSTAWAEETSCLYPEIYIEIDRSYHECTNGHVREGASCDLFLTKIEQVLPAYNCRRSVDSSPVPAIWLFGAAMEDYIRLVYELASGNNPMYTDQWFNDEAARARAIFLSEEFKAVLDGAIAAEYIPLIGKSERMLPNKASTKKIGRALAS